MFVCRASFLSYSRPVATLSWFYFICERNKTRIDRDFKSTRLADECILLFFLGGFNSDDLRSENLNNDAVQCKYMMLSYF